MLQALWLLYKNNLKADMDGGYQYFSEVEEI